MHRGRSDAGRLTNRCFERSWSYEEVVCINADDHYLYTGYNFLQDDTVYHYEQITVHTGDTMWAIADSIPLAA